MNSHSHLRGFLLLCLELGLALLLAACMTLPQQTVTKYRFETPPCPAPTCLPARIVVDEVSGRSLYQRPAMIVSPSPAAVATYTSCAWAESPVVMLQEVLTSYLAQRYADVSLVDVRAKETFDTLLRVYVDALDQENRDASWFAVMRLRYELVSLQDGHTKRCRLFERRRVVAGHTVVDYINAQNQSLQEFLAELSGALPH